jgi:hypothetical protein
VGPGYVGPVTGRTTKRAPKGRRPPDELPSMRERSPMVFWVSVLLLLGLIASVLAGVLVALSR